MNRQNLMRLKDIAARNRCTDGFELHQLFQASPELDDFIHRLRKSNPDYDHRGGFAGLCDFLDVDFPHRLRQGEALTGDAGWLHETLFGTHLNAGGGILSSDELPENAPDGRTIIGLLDEKIQSLLI